jgi:dihydroorotate dehydrogenase electron transfer subunit
MAPLAQTAKEAHVAVTAILSARSKSFVMSEDLLRSAGATTFVVTDQDNTSDVLSVERRIREINYSRPFDYIATCGSNRLLSLAQRLSEEWNILGEAALEQQMGCGIGMCFICVRPFRGGKSESSYRRVCVDGPVFDVKDAMTWSI